MVYASQPANEVYAVTKSMIVNYDATRTARRGPTGWSSSARTSLGDPYTRARSGPSGGRRVDAGAQAHNDMLVKRQNTLIAPGATS